MTSENGACPAGQEKAPVSLGGADRQAFGPGVAGVPGTLEHRLEAVAVALDQHHAQAGELAEIGVELLEQRDPVGDADVAPHLGVAAGDAGEVAETARRVREQQRRIAAPPPPKNRTCESPRIRLKPFFSTIGWHRTV